MGYSAVGADELLEELGSDDEEEDPPEEELSPEEVDGEELTPEEEEDEEAPPEHPTRSSETIEIRVSLAFFISVDPYSLFFRDVHEIAFLSLIYLVESVHHGECAVGPGPLEGMDVGFEFVDIKLPAYVSAEDVG